MVNVALIIIYAIILFELGAAAALHGSRKNDRFNFFITLITNGVVLVLVWWALGWRFI